MVDVTSMLSSTEVEVVKALKNADQKLDDLTISLAHNSTGGADVITVQLDDEATTFNADSSAAGFIVGQVANRLTQGISNTVTPETKKDEIAKMVNQKAGG
jgi:hypothetical protein